MITSQINTDFKNPFLDVQVNNHKIVIIVPSTLNADESIDNSKFVNHIAIELSKMNGGATVTSGLGCWVSDEHGLIKESVNLVSSFTNEIDSKLETIFNLAQWLKTEMTQEAVAVEIDNQLYFI